MNKVKLGILGSVVIAGIVAPLAVQHQSQLQLRRDQESLRRQENELRQLSVENVRLSNRLAQAESSLSLDKSQLSELLRLRGEVGILRRKNEQVEQLRKVNPDLWRALEEWPGLTAGE